MEPRAHSVSVTHSGTFDLDTSPEQAFRLFTAPGETLWVPGWNPTILSGDGTAEGTVFLTGEGEEKTIWVVVDFDVQSFRARYARITPASRAGTVDVRLDRSESGGSTVWVRYQLTALSESGEKNLAGFDAEAYAEMLVEWRQLILAADINFEELADL